MIDPENNEKAPDTVKPVVRFVDDLLAIEILLEGSEPVKQSVRLGNTGWVVYGAGDASGECFW